MSWGARVIIVFLTAIALGSGLGAASAAHADPHRSAVAAAPDGCKLAPVLCAGKKLLDGAGKKVKEEAGEAVENVTGSWLEDLATKVTEAVGVVVASQATAWVKIKGPDLTDGSGVEAANDQPPRTAGVERVFSWVKWTGFVLAGMSLIALLVLFGTSVGGGEGLTRHGARWAAVFGSVLLVSSGSAVVSMLMPAGPRGVDGTAEFLQSRMWWYTGAFAVLSCLVAGARIAWTQRGQPAVELVKSLLTLIVIASCGVLALNLFIQASDAFSVWIIGESLQCEDGVSTGDCFGRNALAMLGLASTNGLGVIVVLTVACVAFLCGLIQIVLMLARRGMLVVLAGVLPTAAAATNLSIGKQWFDRITGWSIAFALYKPAAAIIYAAGFRLMGEFPDNLDALQTTLSGILLFLLALLALPALMRACVPAVSSLAGAASGGAAGAMFAGVGMTAASGASHLGSFSGGGSDGGSSSSGKSDGPSGSKHSGKESAGAGEGGGQGPKGPGGQQPGGGKPGGMPGGGGGMPGGGGGASGAAAGAPKVTGEPISTAALAAADVGMKAAEGAKHMGSQLGDETGGKQ